ncbi:unnamed protein product [Musa acuminata subsp. burmannicoides]
MGPTRLHTAQDGGGPATIAFDDGVEDDDVGIAVESGESDVHESLGRPGATVPSEEGDSGIEGRNVGPESTGDEIAEELEGEIADGGEDQAVEWRLLASWDGEAGKLSDPCRGHP